MFCSVECAHILVITTSGAADKRRHLAPCTSPSQETQVLKVNKATNQLTLPGLTVIINIELVRSLEMVKLSEARCLDYPRFLVSALLLVFSCVCTFYAIIEQKTGFWHTIPGWAALLLFFALLFWLGLMEGLQVALVELKRQDPETYRYSHPHAYKLGQVAAKSDNVEKFLMGRQMFVVFIVFFSAKLTTIHLSSTAQDFLFPIPDWFRSVFLETGLLACVLVVVLAQLVPQIVAAHYPVAFLEYSVMKYGYYACIFLEWTGRQQSTIRY